MMKRILTAAVLVLGATAVVAGTYKWVDKDGNVHYSDKPVEGAEPVTLPEPTTFAAPKAPPREASGDAPVEQDNEAAVAYTDFDFISPKADQVFWATGGEIPVQLRLVPGLLRGHVLNLYFDGELTASSPLTGLGTTLTEVWRGAHTVRAVVVDPSGREIATAGPVTFHVKQHSIANPQNPAAKSVRR